MQSAHQPFGRCWAQCDSPAYAAGLKQILQARISRPVGKGVIQQWVSAQLQEDSAVVVEDSAS